MTHSDRWLRRGAYVLGALCVGQVVTFLVLAPAGGATLTEALGSPWQEEIPFVVEMGLGGLIGAMLAAHRPRNPVGWLAGVLSLGFLAFDVVVTIVAVSPPSPPTWVRLLAWTGNWVWLLGHGGALFLLLLLPNGSALSPRWARVGRLGAAVLLTLAALAAVVPGPLEATPQLTNPFGLAVVEQAEPVFGVLLLAMLLLELLAAVSLVLRFVRSRGTERAQLKWLAWGVAALVVAQAGEAVGVVPRVLAPIGGLAMSVALVVAVTRYRLFEIDRLISRSTTYALLTGGLVAVYAASVVALRAVTTPLGGSSDLAVAGSTLLVAAAFRPLRRRVQLTVDRRFDRARYDAARAAEAFGQQLRDEVELDDVRAELLSTVDATVQPTVASVWLARR